MCAPRPAPARLFLRLGGLGRWVERRDAGDRLAEDQAVDVVRSLVGEDRLEVHHVADHRVVVDDAVGAEDVARQLGRTRAPPRRCSACPARPGSA